ncbi:MAG: type I methionyl aminopeptidase [Bacteroidota bacterium]|jgi:methionyl aminopeptidase
MIYYKTKEEIELIRESSLLVGKTIAEVAKSIKPGVTTLQLDSIAEQFIKDHNAKPSFLGYSGFPNSLCISVNDVVVHGIPSKYVIKEGDIISVDCGVFKNGFHGDSAYSFAVGEVGEDKRKLLAVTLESLLKGIEKVKVGNRIGDVSFAVQQHAEANGYGVVRELVGHGLGKDLHEKPEVPNFGKQGRGQKILEGLVIAIEPMINMGTKNVVHENDGWTIRTQDRKVSAHFEHTVAVTSNGVDVLSSFEEIEKVINK